MKKQPIQLSPDPATSTLDTVHHKGYVAQAEIDLLNEGKRVSIWWSTAPNGTTYPLIYITPAQFAVKVSKAPSLIDLEPMAARIGAVLGTEVATVSEATALVDEPIELARTT